MANYDAEASQVSSVSIQWGGFSFELAGDADLLREGFDLLRSDIFPQLFSGGPPPPPATADSAAGNVPEQESLGSGSGKDEDAPAPAEFVGEKEPKNEVQKVVVIAYYAKFYRQKPEFTVEDLEGLLNEAHLPFKSVKNAVGNASRKSSGGLIKGVPGKRSIYQLTAAGESYVKTRLPHKKGS